MHILNLRRMHKQVLMVKSRPFPIFRISFPFFIVFLMSSLNIALARKIAAQVETARDYHSSSSSYIPSFIREYLEDTATILRLLHDCNDDRNTAIRRLADTLNWREQNKIYPTKGTRNGCSEVVDDHGMAVVRVRHTLTASMSNSYHAQGIDILEDARLALKGNSTASAALVIPVESVSLSRILQSTDSIAQIISDAQLHYPGAISRVYVTAASSVLLEHACQALQPLLSRVSRKSLSSFVTFILADELERSLTPSSLSSEVEEEDEEDEFCSARSRINIRNPSLLSLCEQESTISKQQQQQMTTAKLTHVQLASLQRAVQSVQSVLGSIGDNLATKADSRLLLAVSKSKLVQQADVLMSTVAALNFGVSGSNHQNVVNKATATTGKKSEPTTLAQNLIIQLLALPMTLLVGRKDSLRRFVSRFMRLVAHRLGRLPTLQTLMLLAYKHLRIYAMVLWTGAWLAWQAQGAVIWSNLSTQFSLKRLV